jgi:hypothetical protein
MDARSLTSRLKSHCCFSKADKQDDRQAGALTGLETDDQLIAHPVEVAKQGCRGGLELHAYLEPMSTSASRKASESGLV